MHEKCAKGTPKYIRINSSANILAKIDPAISNLSVHDAKRLGKYDMRSRPTLVELNRTCGVASILSKRNRLEELLHSNHPPPPVDDHPALQNEETSNHFCF